MTRSIFRRILVPHDLSKPADTALRMAAELAEEHGGQLVVLHAVSPIYPFADLPYGAQVTIDAGEIARSAQASLQTRVAKVLRGSPVPVRCHARLGGAFEQIMDAAEDASAIVMSTAGHTGLARLLIGSVTEKIVRHATVPVLTVRPRSRARAPRRRSAIAKKRTTSRSRRGAA